MLKLNKRKEFITNKIKRTKYYIKNKLNNRKQLLITPFSFLMITKVLRIPSYKSLLEDGLYSIRGYCFSWYQDFPEASLGSEFSTLRIS
uniref:Uncharacterized protein n=1 Tax=Heterorhabditis bacteriophora TaxID=37862 RepID=A0A1I7WHE3_HETBA